MSEFTEDKSIGDEEVLWRRIPPWHLIFDENLGRTRPSKAAFDDHPNGSPMSILLAAAVLESGRSAEQVLDAHNGFAMAAITAG